MAHDDRPPKSGVDDWRLQAACRLLDSELFFPDRAVDAARAKAVCRGCPVREICLQAAIDGREKAGIWGGLTPQERVKLARRRRRAAAGAESAGATPRPGRSVVTGSGDPIREEILRGIAGGRRRLETIASHAGHETPLV